MLRRLLCLLGLYLMISTAAATPAAVKPSTSGDSGVWYEIFVRSWYDTNGDGIGDLNALPPSSTICSHWASAASG